MPSRPALTSATVAICSLAVLTACSSSGGGSSAATGSSSSSTSASSSSSSSASAPAPSTSSSAAPSAAAQKYTGLTAGIDSDLQGFLGLPNTTAPAKVRAAAAKVAKDETALVAALRKTTWPSAARPDLANLERTSAAEAAVYAKCAKSSSVTAIKSVLAANKATIAARVAAAAHVRTALGLPTQTQPSSGATG